MGLGFASKGTPMWLLLLDVAGGIAAPGSAASCQIKSRRRNCLGGTLSPLAAADRSIATKSVNPYLPSKYLIIVVSSMALLLWLLWTSIVPDVNQYPSICWERLRGKDAQDMRGSKSR